MTDIAGLCERLRNTGLESAAKAADTIERQAAEIERLRGALAELADAIAAAWPGLENLAPLARARAALTGEDAGGKG
jgi:ketopantoate reductase